MFLRQSNKITRNVIFIFSLFIFKSIFSEGFIAGTLIKTQNGYVPIEQLKENDLVISYDFKRASLTEDAIIGIKKEKTKKVIQLNMQDQVLEVSPDHKFYCPMIKGNWVKAKDLPVNHFLLKDVSELIKIDAIKEIDKETEVYTLSIKNNHNFFVSQQNILVHNVPLIAYFVGEGFKLAGAQELFAYALGFAIAYIAKQNGADTSNYNPFNINRPNPNKWKNHVIKPPKHNFNGMDPDKAWELTEFALVLAIKNKELRNGCEYIVNYATEFGNLVVKGKVVDKAVEVGTAFLQKVY